jgi:ArsR family transcriptional regulator
MTEETYQRQAELFSVLSHPVRLQILDVLARGEACVCHLCAALDQRQAYMSQQLARLKEAGLITDQKQGLYVYYSLTDKDTPTVLRDARSLVARLTGEDSSVETSIRRPGEFDCPCPRCQTSNTVE